MSKFKLNRDYTRLNVRIKNYPERKEKLLINDYGKWVLLKEEEYKKYLFDDMDEVLFKKLEENHIIRTPENARDILESFRNYNWNVGNGTSLQILVPTLRCNFTCKYCYALRRNVDEQGFDMTEETAKKTVDFIFQSPAKSMVIEFTGGEPLLKFDIIKFVVEYAKELNKKHKKILDFAIVTNGNLLDDEKFEFIRKNKIGLCFSLDGPKDLHDFHRKFTHDPKKSSYEDVSRKIKFYRLEKGYNRTFAIPVITKYSLNRYKDIIKEYVLHGLPIFRFKYVTYFGFAVKSWESLFYEPEEFIEAWKRVIRFLLFLNKKGIRAQENLASYILMKIVNNRDPGFAELERPCGAFIGQALYDYDGSIYTCDEARTMDEEFKIGNVYEDTFYDLTRNKLCKTMVSNSSLLSFNCDNCPWYPYCGICPVENYKMHGSLVVNLPSTHRCKIHKAMIDYLFDLLLHSPEDA
ncbi:MAG: uncharacterized protein PWP03_758, partial [Candidatus Woesearchaeota archaeon]|nr:uncharacterized protein [Candidatus Woesearchaeota archaeon]